MGSRCGRLATRHRITRLADYRAQSIAGTSTAIVFPIYNEKRRPRL